MAITKKRAKNILNHAIDLCKKDIEKHKLIPCGGCNVNQADMSVGTKMTVLDVELSIDCDLCENCYDNIRYKINTLDLDTID